MINKLVRRRVHNPLRKPLSQPARRRKLATAREPLEERAMLSTDTLFYFHNDNPARHDNVSLEQHAIFETANGGENGFVTLAGDLVDRDGDGDKEPALSQKGSIIIEPPRLREYFDNGGSMPDPVRSFTAQMNISIHEDFEGTGGDGISFGYGNLSGNAFGEEGDRRSGAGGLWVSIDTYAGNPERIGISVFYGDQLQTPQLVNHWTYHDKDDLRGAWTRLKVDVTAAGVLSISFQPNPDGRTYSSTSILTERMQLPSWNPHGTWQFGVGARTGAAADWHVLEDMTITEKAPPAEKGIVWTNRGEDNFDSVFGSVAENARRVVDAVINGWEQIINDFNYSFGYNRFEVDVTMSYGLLEEEQNHGGHSSHDYDLDFDHEDYVGEIDPDGRPRRGRIVINRGNGSGPTALSSGWDVGGWFIDATPSDWSEFDGSIASPFTGFASHDSPAADLADLYSVVSHELAHLLGLSSLSILRLQEDPGGYLTNTHETDTVYGTGTLWTFDGPSVRALLTSNNKGADGMDAGRPGHTARRQIGDPVAGYAGSTEIMNPTFAFGQRDLPSNLVALLLKDAYGYDITMPERFGSFYSSLDKQSHELTVRGSYYGDDVVDITRRGSTIRVSVDVGDDTPGTGPTDAFVSFYNVSDVSSIRVKTRNGNDQISIGPGLGIPADVDGGRGVDSDETDDLTIFGTSGDDTITTTENSVTVNGVTTTYDGIDNLVVDGLAGSDTITSNGSSTTIRGGAGNDTFTVNETGDHELVLEGQDGADTYTINFGQLVGPVTILESDSTAGGGDVVAINGTPANDRLLVSSGGVSLGGQRVNLDATITNVAVSGGGGTDELVVEEDSSAPLAVEGIPIVHTIDDQTAQEGGVVSFTTTFTDSDLADTHTAMVDWGDGVVEPISIIQDSGSVGGSHVYADNGTYTPLLTIEDSSGQQTETSWSVKTDNVSPGLAAQPRQIQGSEGIGFNLEWGFGDLGTLDTHEATIDWGDGSVVESATIDESPFGPPGSATGQSGTIHGTHVYAENGVYPIRVSIMDDDGESHSATASITVSNVAPQLQNVASTSPINENDVATLAGNIVDPGRLDTFTLEVDWGDGSPVEIFSYPAGTTSFSETHQYLDDGTSPGNGTSSDEFTVDVGLRDDDSSVGRSYYLDFGDDYLGLPSSYAAAAPSAGTWNEVVTLGASTNLVDTTGAATAASVEVAADSASGHDSVSIPPLAEETLLSDNFFSGAGNNWSVMFSGLTDGIYDVFYYAPANNNVSTRPFQVGGTAVSGIPGDATSLLQGTTYDVQSGVGVAGGSLTLASTSAIYTGGLSGLQLVNTAPAEGSHDSVQVIVENVAPTIDSLVLSADTIDENGSVTVDGSFTDPGTLDKHQVIISWGDGSDEKVIDLTVGDRAFTATHQYLDDDPSGTSSDNYTITATVTDDDNGNGSASDTVVVQNLAPENVAIDAGVQGYVFAVGADKIFGTAESFTDIGKLDMHTAEWSFSHAVGQELVEEIRSGTVLETVGTGTGTVSDTFSFAEPGVYTTTLTVIDDDTGSTESEEVTFVVYDPSEGFVTGGGWIHSPEGAYTAEPTLTGKASFGFASKYKKGANTPTGQTQFQFKMSDMKFHSDAYEWLVVAGARAQYKGVGTINGTGDYGFMLTAIDGQVNGGGGTDKFRIKIWDRSIGDAESSDSLVYDNQPGDRDNDDAALTTELGGGQVVIHSGKSNLVVSGSAAHLAEIAGLSQPMLDAAVGEAVGQWSDAGLNQQQLAVLDNISVEMAGLSGSTLGIASESTNKVWLDIDGAGLGWSTDASSGSYDLLSAVDHEIGHKLGYDHGVMDDSLAAGERHLASAHVHDDRLRTGLAGAAARSDVLFESLGGSDHDPELDDGMRDTEAGPARRALVAARDRARPKAAAEDLLASVNDQRQDTSEEATAHDEFFSSLGDEVLEIQGKQLAV